jgi:scyllo-inositol 2-dehydrogenase (NADP+)
MPKLLTSPIKCGVIGYGGSFNMGRGHLDEMTLAGMVPTAVCELDPTRLEQAGRDFPGIGLFDSVEQMLAESAVELLAIITPHNTHAPLAIQCLNAGKNVISEKPFAISTEECDDMIAAAERNDRMVSCYHNRHWDGHILAAVDHLVKQRLAGDIVRINIHWGGRAMPRDWWRSDRSMSGGILYDWGVHLLEYALQLLPGAKCLEVTGFAKEGYWVGKSSAVKAWHKNANEDEARIVARMDNGVAIDLTVTQIDDVGMRSSFEVVGTEGHYSMAFQSWTRTYNEGLKKIIESGPQPPGESVKLYQNVNDHLTRGETLVITPEYARRMIHFIDLAGQSAKQGRSLATTYG